MILFSCNLFFSFLLFPSRYEFFCFRGCGGRSPRLSSHFENTPFNAQTEVYGAGAPYAEGGSRGMQGDSSPPTSPSQISWTSMFLITQFFPHFTLCRPLLDTYSPEMNEAYPHYKTSSTGRGFYKPRPHSHIREGKLLLALQFSIDALSKHCPMPVPCHPY